MLISNKSETDDNQTTHNTHWQCQPCLRLAYLHPKFKAAYKFEMYPNFIVLGVRGTMTTKKNFFYLHIRPD